ncbi:unnamed protein product [Adineta ricciae]|uniref:Peptidase C1A papain C-terminal domain-containing protein n=1 Tax=Adineta ricciae TaxID=249248 RepID=A0A815NB45_ADIRI|nr:unnamed protein product [Adineta ricciae]CAF1504926.1 unnamed protein product [Adineta ricciae]
MFNNITNYCVPLFKENFKYITTSRLDFRDGRRNFNLALNKFSHLTIDEIRKFHTGSRVKKSRRFGRSLQPSTKSLDIPKSSDDHRKYYMQSVTDQGKCGSCVAQDVSAAVEGVYALKNNVRLSLNRQMLIDCDWFIQQHVARDHSVIKH